MNTEKRVLAYRKQAGKQPDEPHVLTPKQRRRVKQKSNFHHHHPIESGEL